MSDAERRPAIAVRPPEPHEADALLACSEAAYHLRYPSALRERILERVDTGAFRCAYVEGELVGVAAGYDLELTVPGPCPVAVAGWSEIAVLPTFRRRGVLRALVETLAAEALDRGRLAAVLFASEGGIYGRFGFAPACLAARYRLDLRRGALRPLPELAGRVHLLGPLDAGSALPEVFDLARRRRTGEIDRGPAGWQALLEQGAPPAGAARFVCCHERAGRIDGYAVYDVGGAGTGAGSGEDARRRLELVELVALGPEAETALWRYLLGTDLVAELVTAERPVDEPLRHLLADPRALETTALQDHLWLRLLDLPGALAARRYATAGTLVLEPEAPGERGGRLLLEADDDGAAVVTATARPADVHLDVAALAACYLGGTTLAALARAGRVTEGAPGGLRRASALFGAGEAPFCTADV